MTIFRDVFIAKDCRSHIIKHYIIPFAFSDFCKTLLIDNIKWEDFLSRIPEYKRVQALSTCILRPRITFCNEFEAIRFVINVTDKFNSLIKKAESKDTELAAAYLKTKSFFEEFDGECDERVEEKNEAENTMKVAKEASCAAFNEATLVRNSVFKSKKKLLVSWRKSVNGFANREFEKLASILFPIAPILTEQDKSSDEFSVEGDGDEEDIDKNKETIDSNNDLDNDELDEDTEETYKKRKRESDDENEDEEDDECGPAYFNLTDLNSYPKKRLVSLLEEVDSLTSILQDDCMSSKDPSSNFIVL